MIVFTMNPHRHLNCFKLFYNLEKKFKLKEKSLERLCINCQFVIDKIYNKPLTIIKDKCRFIKVFDCDIWDADVTIAELTFSIIKKLQENKNSFFIVNDDDVPDELKSSLNLNQHSSFMFDIEKKKSDYVINEILFALNCCYIGSDENKFRINNGLELFGKYFKNLWI